MLYNPVWFRRVLIALLFLEACWAILWMVSMFVFQLADGTTEQIRYSHFFMLFHATMPLALLNLFEGPQQKKRHDIIKLTMLFWMIVVVMSDLNSALETFLHVTVGDESIITLLHVNAITGICVSGLGTIWYAVVLFSSHFDDGYAK